MLSNDRGLPNKIRESCYRTLHYLYPVKFIILFLRLFAFIESLIKNSLPLKKYLTGQVMKATVTLGYVRGGRSGRFKYLTS